MYGRAPQAKLIDFGISHDLENPHLVPVDKAGSAPYMAPELFNGQVPPTFPTLPRGLFLVRYGCRCGYKNTANKSPLCLLELK